MTTTAHDIAMGVRRGARSAAAAVRESLDAIRARNTEVNAFVEVFEHAALRRAQEIDELARAGQAEGLALAGVPVAIKDNICVGPDLLALTGTTGDAVWSAPGDPADSLNLHSAGKAATLLPCSAALPCCPHKPTTTTTTPQPPQTAAALL